MDAFGVAAIVLYTLVLGGTAVHATRSIARWLRVRPVRVVPRHRHTGSTCIVCASRGVRTIAPYVVRCDECGFLGGAGVRPLRGVLADAALDASLVAAAPSGGRGAAGRPLPSSI